MRAVITGVAALLFALAAVTAWTAATVGDDLISPRVAAWFLFGLSAATVAHALPRGRG